MHGLINRALENFVCGAYGETIWQKIVGQFDFAFESFEPMMLYDEHMSDELIDLAARELGKPVEVFLEDFGTFLVTNPASQRVRRLLRFGGVDFLDFLHSLDDLRGRAKLALPDFDLPRLVLDGHGNGAFSLHVECTRPGGGYVVLGVLRAMADDYGALVFVEHMGGKGPRETLSIALLDEAYGEDRGFNLAEAVG
jgi:hypothetical protein